MFQITWIGMVDHIIIYQSSPESNTVNLISQTQSSKWKFEFTGQNQILEFILT